MKPTTLIPIATMGAICGLAFFGVAPETLAANTHVDVELAILLQASGSSAASNDLFDNIKDAHVELFQSRDFFNTFVKPLPNQKIAVSFWIYADGTAQPVNWTLIDSQAAAENFGTLINDQVFKNLPLLRTDLGLAIQNATASINTNDYDGDYRILNLASNGAQAPSDGSPDAEEAALKALNPSDPFFKISAINSISTTQVPTSVLPAIQGLSGNDDNPVNEPGFSLTDLSFEPNAPNPYGVALRDKIFRETRGTRPVTTPEPSALWALFGLSLVPLVSKKTKNQLIKQGRTD